jgi:hypothetical protein
MKGTRNVGSAIQGSAGKKGYELEAIADKDDPGPKGWLGAGWKRHGALRRPLERQL